MFDSENPAWKRFICRVLGAFLILFPFALFFVDIFDLFQMFLGILIGASVIFLFEFSVEDHFARQRRDEDREKPTSEGAEGGPEFGPSRLEPMIKPIQLGKEIQRIEEPPFFAIVKGSHTSEEVAEFRRLWKEHMDAHQKRVGRIGGFLDIKGLSHEEALAFRKAIEEGLKEAQESTEKEGAEPDEREGIEGAKAPRILYPFFTDLEIEEDKDGRGSRFHLTLWEHNSRAEELESFLISSLNSRFLRIMERSE